MGEVLLWGIEFRVQDAGARRVSNAEGIRGIIRKHDYALPAQYTKHSNAWGGHIRVRVRVRVRVRIRIRVRVRVRVKLRVRIGVRGKTGLLISAK